MSVSGAVPPAHFRAVVVDDEPAAREVIASFLAREPDIELAGEAANGDEAVELIRRLRPDLLFLDVQMPDRDGFGVLEALGSEVPAGVVFVTAHDEHALKAFEVHALDYLLKPFGFGRFHAAVERALKTLRAEVAFDLQATLETLVRGQRTPTERAATLIQGDRSSDTPHSAARIGVRRGDRTILVEVDEIDWIEAADDHARLHVGSKPYLVSSRMHELEVRLGAQGFLRIHRSAIVNLAKIEELERDANGGGLVTLRSGLRLRVSRGRWDGLRRALGVE